MHELRGASGWQTGHLSFEMVWSSKASLKNRYVKAGLEKVMKGKEAAQQARE